MKRWRPVALGPVALGIVAALTACRSTLYVLPIEIPPGARNEYDAARARLPGRSGKPPIESLRQGLDHARAALTAAPDQFRLAVLVQDYEFLVEREQLAARYPVPDPAAPADARALTLAARALLPGNLREARGLLTRAVESDPTFAWACFSLAFVERQEGHVEAARRFAEEALKRDPSLLEALRLLAEVAEESGARDDAVAARRELVRVAGDAPDERRILAQLLLESDDTSEVREARVLLRELLADLSERAARDGGLPPELQTMRCETLLDLGTAWALRDGWEEAVDFTEQARAIDPGSLLALYNLGVIKRSQGDREGALAAFEEYMRRAQTQGGPMPAEEVLYRHFYVPHHLAALRRELEPAPPAAESRQ